MIWFSRSRVGVNDAVFQTRAGDAASFNQGRVIDDGAIERSAICDSAASSSRVAAYHTLRQATRVRAAAYVIGNVFANGATDDIALMRSATGKAALVRGENAFHRSAAR